MTRPQALPVEALYRHCDPGVFSFETTAELEESRRMLGQDRAVQAIRLGTGLDLEGYNLFVLGPPGTGRHSFVRQFLRQKAADRPVPSDWCYVNNFDDPRKPVALELPAGQGRSFREDIARLIGEARSAISAAFEREDYHQRLQEIEKQAKEEQASTFDEIRKHAKERGLDILQTATGFTFVPLSKGEPFSPEEFEKLPDEEKERLERGTEEVGEELRRMLRAIPRQARQVHERIQKLNREVALFAVGGLVEELLEKYADHPKAANHLKNLQQDIADHIDLFTELAEGGPKALKQLLTGRLPGDELQESPIARRYGVNLLVDRSEEEGAPVVFEDHPTYPYLVGQIEHTAHMGALVTDFNLIRGGALHRANGGYLVMDVRKVLMQPFAWDALKRALRSREVDIKSLAQAYSLVSTVSLEPEPIPLDVKVVLIGERQLYYLLDVYDPEFPKLFKVAADFEDQMDRSDENVQGLARLLGTLASAEELKPLERGAVARLVEESARHAGDGEMLSTRIQRLTDLMREAHYWSVETGREAIGAAEVQRAIDGQVHRMGRLRDRLLRETLRGTLLIDTDGEKIGQVNGLAVMQVGEYPFGHPHRITARLSLGSGKVIDIEREVELGGPIHSKGVLILSGFLASHYVTDQPLSLSASLVFEQSYGLVDGDSASAAELCALLSALAEAPIRQSFAITGSVNQHGRIQAIGGVNEKIEGFFDLCQARELTGRQGVIIPESNVPHLMLRRDVIDAVAQGRFHVHAARTVDECMELLTGLDAGERDKEGQFPEGSLNRRILDRLLDLAEKRRAFGARGEESDEPTRGG